LNLFRRLYRAIKVIAHFSYGTVELAITRPKTRAARAAWLSHFCARLARSMEIRLNVVGPVPMQDAIISNHLTYVDIVLHAAARPCVFVSKIELRSTPLLGWMSMMSGTVYVARGFGGSAAKAAEGMAKGLRDGLPVVFFPEGTTGVGDEPTLPFRSGLLMQTLEAEVPIVPAFISYELSPKDVAAGRTLRNDVHWGPQSLPAHMWAFFGLHELKATIRFAESAIVFSKEALANRKIAAVEAQEAVVALASQEPVSIG
jgi:lyso-ornithine lipid O-acyltransferase